MAAVKDMYGFTSSSDNIVDANIMAKIAEEIWLEKNVFRLLPNFQTEVIQSILKGAS